MNKEKIIIAHLKEIQEFLKDVMVKDDSMLARGSKIEGKIELLIDLLENFKS